MIRDPFELGRQAGRTSASLETAIANMPAMDSRELMWFRLGFYAGSEPGSQEAACKQ